MRRVLIVLFLLIPCVCFARVSGGGVTTANVMIQEEDGDPSGKLNKLRVTNASLTKNAEGDYSLDTGASGGGAPTDADYLVGTANASLSAEIVVGTTELDLTNLGSTLVGGSATTADLNLKTTSGVGEAGADMHFLVGNNGATEAMTILNSGNVGIGTTGPRTTLDVQSSANNAFVLQKTASTGFSISSYWPSLNINMRHDGTQWRGLGAGYVAAWSQNPTTGLMELGLSTASVTADQALGDTPTVTRLAITTTGNVGIGVTDPDAKLEVSGNIHLTTDSNKLLFGTASDASIYYDGTDMWIKPDEVGSGHIRIEGDIETDRWGNSDTNLMLGVGVAGAGNMTGTENVGLGGLALYAITSGYYNIGIGYQALTNVTSGNSNFAMGSYALQDIGTGYQNVAIGAVAGQNITGSRNFALGGSSMRRITSGQDNVAIGNGAMHGATIPTTSVGSNVAIGTQAMTSVASNAGRNVGIGYWALKVINGNGNVAIGYLSGDAATTANDNVMIGDNSGGALTTGDSNIFLGHEAGSQLTTESNLLYIDNSNTTTPLIWGDMSARELRFGEDNTKTFWGTGKDASIYYDGSDMYFNSREVGTGDFIFSNGNVGIGTTSPTTRLEIASGGITITEVAAPATPAATKAVLYIVDDGDSTTSLYVKFDDGTTVRLAGN